MSSATISEPTHPLPDAAPAIAAPIADHATNVLPLPPLRPDKAIIARFVRSMFRHAAPETYASLRGFDQADSNAAPCHIEAVPVDNLDNVTDRAVYGAGIVAAALGVFCPPICTFGNPGSAAAVNVSQGLALSVDIDSGNTSAKRAVLEAVLGPATMAVASGGECRDPETCAEHDKLHLHWRLSLPTQTAEDHARLVDARRWAAQLVGGDGTAGPIVHPLRWPGTVHLKGAPRLARIVAETDAEIDLGAALRALHGAADAAGVVLKPHTVTRTLTAVTVEEDIPVNVARAVEVARRAEPACSGVWHPYGFKLGARLCRLGLSADKTVEVLEANWVPRGTGYTSRDRFVADVLGGYEQARKAGEHGSETPEAGFAGVRSADDCAPAAPASPVGGAAAVSLADRRAEAARLKLAAVEAKRHAHTVEADAKAKADHAAANPSEHAQAEAKAAKAKAAEANAEASRARQKAEEAKLFAEHAEAQAQATAASAKANAEANRNTLYAGRMAFHGLRERLAKDGAEQFRATHANLLMILKGDPLLTGLVRRDAFADRIVLTRAVPVLDAALSPAPGPYPRELQDADTTRIQAYLQREWSHEFRSAGVVSECLTVEAQDSAFHPVCDWLDSLAWDGQPRLKSWLHRVFGGERSAYVDDVGAKFLIAAVRRVRQPGCKFDTLVVLEGDQGMGKSRALRALFGPDWYTDKLPENLSSKDASGALAGVWGIEMGEIVPLLKSDPETVKAFLSRQVERYRPPYGRRDISVPRQSVMIGTTNAREYLRDTTGNRRFWPVRCGAGQADAAWLIQNREQLWAEAAAAEARGDSIWFDDAEMQKVASEVQTARLTRDVWTDTVEQYVADKDMVTVSSVLGAALMVPKAQQDQRMQNRVGGILELAGWAKPSKPVWDREQQKAVRAWTRERPKPTAADQLEKTV